VRAVSVPTLKSAQVVLLRAINTQMPHAAREEPTVPACSAVGAATIRRTFRAQDIVRMLPERRVFQTVDPITSTTATQPPIGAKQTRNTAPP